MHSKTRERKRRRAGFGAGVLYALLTILGIFMALPIVYMASTAFKPLDELFLYPPRFFVRRPTMENFEGLLMATSGVWVPFSRYVLNSVFVATVSVIGGVFISTLAAYPLAKHRVPGRNFIFAVIISALMFAPEVTQIPRYLLVNKLGLIDTYGALILPSLALPLGLFLMKQFLEQIPDALLEAAKVDGATEWQIFTRIILAMSRPAWATVTIFLFITVWNDTFGPMVFTRSEAMKTLPLAIQTISGGAGVVARTGSVAAASLLTTLPVIVIFVLLQRRVLQTMAYSGIKS